MCVVTKYARGRVQVEVINRTHADVTIEFDAALANLGSNPPLPVTRVVAPQAKLFLAALTPVRRGVAWNYASEFRYVYGSLWARHDARVRYALPWCAGESHAVMQGFHGSLSHHGQDEYAVDFDLPFGTPVRAAREGTVIMVKSDSDRGCPTDECKHLANYVLVRHIDGSVAEYGHLRHHGVRVRPGALIARGDILAESGATGWVTAPHLHFVVRVARNARTWESVPVAFSAVEGEVAEPAEAARYTALP